MAGSVKTLTVCTVAGLVLVTGYTVALGASAWLWFVWAVLGLATLGAFAARRN